MILNDEGGLNFDKSFLHFNVKKKIYSKVTLNLTVDILDAGLNSSLIDSYNNANSYLTLQASNEKNKILNDVKKSTLCDIPLQRLAR